MAKLIMLRGISGSGKSTKAKELTQTHNCFRVNRDDLRKMMYDGKWSGDKEKAVVIAEKAIIKDLLDKGKSVVVDDTNLLASHETMWRSLVTELNANKEQKIKFEIMEIRTLLADCIWRDKVRTDTITEAVIQRQAIKSGMYNLSTEDNSIVLCDIDGTIADGSHREHILDDKTDKQRWQKYFSLCANDAPIISVIARLRQLKEEGKQIVLVSGRAADLTLDNTNWWLKEHNVPYDRLLMRLGGDGRPDTDVKTDILNEILLHHPKSAIAFVIDDRPAVVKTWIKHGIKVIPVYKGEEITDFFTEHKDDCKEKGNPIKGRCTECGALNDF